MNDVYKYLRRAKSCEPRLLLAKLSETYKSFTGHFFKVSRKINIEQTIHERVVVQFSYVRISLFSDRFLRFGKTKKNRNAAKIIFENPKHRLLKNAGRPANIREYVRAQRTQKEQIFVVFFVSTFIPFAVTEY